MPYSGGGADICPIGWSPNIWQPVFYGFEDVLFRRGTGRKPIRILYPSIDGSPAYAELLKGCGTFPFGAYMNGMTLFKQAGCEAWLEWHTKAGSSSRWL